MLLLVSLVCFSGAAQASLLLVDPAASHDSCCPPLDDQPADGPSAPCSSLECQCLGCSGALIQPLTLIIGVTPVSVARMSCDPGILLSGFTPLIDYPPESV